MNTAMLPWPLSAVWRLIWEVTQLILKRKTFPCYLNPKMCTHTHIVARGNLRLNRRMDGKQPQCDIYTFPSKCSRSSEERTESIRAGFTSELIFCAWIQMSPKPNRVGEAHYNWKRQKVFAISSSGIFLMNKNYLLALPAGAVPIGVALIVVCMIN